jgi:carboxyl-terminal processing protease
MPLTAIPPSSSPTARYYTPSGRSVEEGGIDPDIAVPQKISDLRDLRQTRASASTARPICAGHLIDQRDQG